LSQENKELMCVQERSAPLFIAKFMIVRKLLEFQNLKI